MIISIQSDRTDETILLQCYRDVVDKARFLETRPLFITLNISHQ